jgi:hypothetical protein
LLDTLTRALGLSRRELAVLACAFLISLPAVTPRIYASDEIQYFSYLRSLWFDRDVSFENEYQYFFERNVGRGEGFHQTFLEQYTGAGRRPSFATIGSALLWSPCYAIADVVTRLSGGTADGYSYPYIAAVAYGSAFYGVAAIVLSISAARRLTGHGLLAGAVIWLGTPLLFYMYVSPPYSHACSAFAVALFVTIWLRVRERWTVGGAVALGLSGALMASVREQDVFLAIGPAVDFVWWTFGRAASGNSDRAADFRRALGVAVTGIIAFAVGLIPQLLAYKALNGHFGPSRLVTRKMNWQAPHALEVLVSPEHGLFIWTPLAAFALLGLLLLALRGESTVRRFACCALLMVAFQVYVSGSVESWTVAGAFGQRRFVALTILLTIGLASLLVATTRTAWKPAVTAALALGVWWNLALIVEFGTGMMNRQRLEPARNAYDAFVTIPQRAPMLAYRYFFDRSSFYQKKE